jgi:hypothetical protein
MRHYPKIGRAQYYSGNGKLGRASSKTLAACKFTRARPVNATSLQASTSRFALFRGRRSHLQGHDTHRATFHVSGHFGGHFGGHYWGHGYGYNHWWHPYPWHFCHYGWYCHPHIGIGVGVASTVVTGSSGAASAPASAPATGGCLSKRELPDGSALFRDRCTGEQADSQTQGGAGSR